MSDAPQELSTRDVESYLQDMISQAVADMGDDQRKKLSKVLYPDTHKESVEINGKTFNVTPVPLRISKRISAALEDFSEQARKAATDTKGDAFDASAKVADQISEVAKIMCGFYMERFPEGDWGQLLEDLKAENIGIAEIQDLVMTQQVVQGTNDFLFIPLRLAIRLMQVQEILTVTGLSLGQSKPTTPLS